MVNVRPFRRPCQEAVVLLQHGEYRRNPVAQPYAHQQEVSSHTCPIHSSIKKMCFCSKGCWAFPQAPKLQITSSRGNSCASLPPCLEPAPLHACTLALPVQPRPASSRNLVMYCTVLYSSATPIISPLDCGSLSLKPLPLAAFLNVSTCEDSQLLIFSLTKDSIR